MQDCIKLQSQYHFLFSVSSEKQKIRTYEISFLENTILKTSVSSENEKERIHVQKSKISGFTND